MQRLEFRAFGLSVTATGVWAVAAAVVLVLASLIIPRLF